MRIVFAGTPAVAVPALRALVEAGYDVAGVVTRPDAPLGRKRVLTPSPVAQAADELGLPVLKHAKLDDAASDAVEALGAELGVVVAYGGLVRRRLLDALPHGWINLHFSVLPAWRGAAPVQHSLIAGGAGAGSSVFRLVPELDAGDVFASAAWTPGADDTAADALDALAVIGTAQLVDVVAAIADGTAAATPQGGAATLAPKLSLADGHVELTAGAERCYDRFRGVTPEPGAYVLVGEQRLKIHEARRAADVAPVPCGRFALVGTRLVVGTSDEPLELITVQPAGKARMRAADWWRGQVNNEVEAR